MCVLNLFPRGYVEVIQLVCLNLIPRGYVEAAYVLKIRNTSNKAKILILCKLGFSLRLCIRVVNLKVILSNSIGYLA